MIMPGRKRSKKWVSWLIILILLIAAGVVCYLVWDNYFNNKKDDNVTTETSEQMTEEKKTSDAAVDNEDEDEGQKVKQYEGESPNKANELSGVITYAGVVGDKIMIRVNIDQYLEEGTCELNITNGGQVVYEEAVNIVGSATTSTCEGFDFSSSTLGSGNYGIIIKIETNNKSGVIEGSLDI